jgi:hypothetical protein
MSGGDLTTYGLYLPTGLSSVTIESGAPGITAMTVVGTAPVISDTSTEITFDVPSPTTFSPPAPTTANLNENVYAGSLDLGSYDYIISNPPNPITPIEYEMGLQLLEDTNMNRVLRGIAPLAQMPTWLYATAEIVIQEQSAGIVPFGEDTDYGDFIYPVTTAMIPYYGDSFYTGDIAWTGGNNSTPAGPSFTSGSSMNAIMGSPPHRDTVIQAYPSGSTMFPVVGCSSDGTAAAAWVVAPPIGGTLPGTVPATPATPVINADDGLTCSGTEASNNSQAAIDAIYGWSTNGLGTASSTLSASVSGTTLSATVTPSSSAQYPPTGEVIFYDAPQGTFPNPQQVICHDFLTQPTPNPLVSTASCTTASPPSGPVWAVYTGDMTYAQQQVQVGSTTTGTTTGVGTGTSPTSGYREVASDGGIFSFGDAQFYGSMGGHPLNKPIVGIASTPDGKGYWEVASDGGIFSFGDAQFYGSMGGHPLNKPIVGIASTPDGKGYWEVASDGGIFSFGDAQFYGSMGGHPLNKPIVGIASTPDGKGYWEVASDGGIFSFGDAQFYGSMGGHPLNKPIVGIASTPDGKGYWEVASDGGIFAFGDAQFYGSMGGHPLNKPIVGLA